MDEKLEERVSKLEQTIRDAKIAGSVLAFALVLFLGYTWTSIPRRAADAIEGEAVREAENAAIASAESARGAADSALASAAKAKSQLEMASTIVAELESTESARLTQMQGQLDGLSARHEQDVVLWGVNSGDEIYWSSDEGRTWHRVPGGLKQIAVGPGILWGVNSSDEIWWTRDRGQHWTRVNGRLKYIAISP